MEIKTSVNEGQIHIDLKKKVIEMLIQRDDIVDISTEYRVSRRNKWRKGKIYRWVDVHALKKDGGNIYAEVKVGGEGGQALVQLVNLGKNGPNDEFIIVYQMKSLQFVKNIWRNKEEYIREFVNKTDIYTYDDDLDLYYKDIEFRNGEAWVDGKMEFPKVVR